MIETIPSSHRRARLARLASKISSEIARTASSRRPSVGHNPKSRGLHDDHDRLGAPNGERCARVARELAGTCAAYVAAEKPGDATSGEQQLEHCAHLCRELAAVICAAGDSIKTFCDDSLTRKRLKRALADCVAADEAGHTTSGGTWREQSTRLSLVQGYANVAELAAEFFGDESGQNVAHIAYGDAEDALRRLTEEHLPEIEADYDEIWAALEAERAAKCRSALSSTAHARTRARRPAQARTRARRPRRSRPRRPASSSDSNGEPPGARRERGAPTSQTIAARAEERHANAHNDSAYLLVSEVAYLCRAPIHGVDLAAAPVAGVSTTDVQPLAGRCAP